MTLHKPSYYGDAEYSIYCTGDVVTGDEIRFERATFAGSYRRPVFTGFELVTGKVIRESYGQIKQQHTFTVALPDGQKLRIKGRNLYANGVFRKPWANESARKAAQEEKHARGDCARAAREERKAEQAFFSKY